MYSKTWNKKRQSVHTEVSLLQRRRDVGIRRLHFARAHTLFVTGRGGGAKLASRNSRNEKVARPSDRVSLKNRLSFSLSVGETTKVFNSFASFVPLFWSHFFHPSFSHPASPFPGLSSIESARGMTFHLFSSCRPPSLPSRARYITRILFKSLINRERKLAWMQSIDTTRDTPVCATTIGFVLLLTGE